MYNKQAQFVGFNSDPIPTEGTEIWMEVDLRSERREERTLRFFINKTQQKIFFYNLPPSIMFGFCLRGADDAIEFVSLDELSSPIHKEKRDEFGYLFEGDD